MHTVDPDRETFALVAVYDAADELEAGLLTALEHGIAPQLAALRAIVGDGSPPTLAFVWGASRIVPVEVLSLTVTETMFDSSLLPAETLAALGIDALG